MLHNVYNRLGDEDLNTDSDFLIGFHFKMWQMKHVFACTHSNLKHVTWVLFNVFLFLENQYRSLIQKCIT